MHDVLGNSCERVIQPPKGVEIRRLRTADLDGVVSNGLGVLNFTLWKCCDWKSNFKYRKKMAFLFFPVTATMYEKHLIMRPPKRYIF